MNTVQYDKLLSSLRYWLIGKAEHDSRYYMTLDALEYARSIHTGKRKDGVTEEFYHQLNIVSFMRTLVVYFEKPHILLAVALLHDTIEDYAHTENEVVQKFPDVYPYLKKISKMRNGTKLSNSDYFANMSGCPITVVAKCVDRIHNLSTMDGVFSVDKMQSYIDDVRSYFLPMLKETRRLQPKYEAVFELLKTTLLLMVSNVESIISRDILGDDEKNNTPTEKVDMSNGIVLYDDRGKRDNVHIPFKDIKFHDDDWIAFMYNCYPGLIDLKTSKVSHEYLGSYHLLRSEKNQDRMAETIEPPTMEHSNGSYIVIFRTATYDPKDVLIICEFDETAMLAKAKEVKFKFRDEEGMINMETGKVFHPYINFYNFSRAVLHTNV